MEHLWGKDSFDSVPDGVSEVDEVAKSSLAFVDSDDVGFDIDTASDDGEEQRLGSRTRADVTTCVACRRRTDSSVDQGSMTFEGSEFIFIPYRCGLWGKLGSN
jgi:hypothetical protein